MNIILYGATGNAGSRILTELTSRGHKVTAVARTPSKVAALPGVTAIQGDIFSPDAIATAIAGSDAVVSAYGPPHDDTDQVVIATENLVQAVEKKRRPASRRRRWSRLPLRRSRHHPACLRLPAAFLPPHRRLPHRRPR